MPEIEIKEEAVERIEEEKEEEARKKAADTSYIWKTILVVGLVALLILGILLPIRIVPNVVSDLRDTVAGFFGAKKGLSLDKRTITSGDTFTLDLSSASTSPETNTAFVFSYPCREGVYFEYSKTGEAADSETISCETPFTFTSDTKKISLKAVSLTQKSVEQPVTINLMTLGDETASSSEVQFGTVTLVINNPLATTTPAFTEPTISTSTATTTGQTPHVPQTPVATTTPHTTSTTTVSSGGTPAPQPVYVPTDLVVSGLQVGTIINGQFVQTATVRSTDNVVIKFTISNQGSRSTAGWMFDAYIPTLDPQFSVYHSPAQGAIGQGSGVINSLSVNNLRPGMQTITIVLDPAAHVSDSNRSNNKITATINIVP